jgi:hypothetical protein
MENKTITFNVSGYGGTNGTTISYVKKLLEGSYTLTLDGDAITNVDTVINETTAEEGIKITYPHNTHVIEITGGSVVVLKFHQIMKPILLLLLKVLLWQIIIVPAEGNKCQRQQRIYL